MVASHNNFCSLLLPVLLIIILTINNNASALARELTVGYLTTCAPREDCGFGIWNDDTCECSCIPPYCYDELYESCVAQGSCQNPFQGCTPYASCPYYYNLAGKCESSPNIFPGVFSVFWDAESCCRANFPSEVSTCIADSVETSKPTLAPTVKVAAPKELLSIAPIPMTMRFINETLAPTHDEDHIVQALESIIFNSTSTEIESELDAISLESIKVSTTMNDDEKIEMNLELQPVVSVTKDMPSSDHDLRVLIWNVLNNQINNITDQVEILFEVDLLLTIPPISIQNNSDNKDNENLLIAILASALSVLFVVMCVIVALVIWRRRKRIKELPTKAKVTTATVVDGKASRALVASGTPLPQRESANGMRSSFRSQDYNMDAGYEGGDSSHSINAGFNESDFSFPTTDDSSKEDGNSVLGLLYYDGPCSSESDEDGHRSRGSRRSKNSNRTPTKRRKSREGTTPKSRRRNRGNPMDKLNEDCEYHQRNEQGPNGFDASTIMSETVFCSGDSFSPTKAPSITGDSFVDNYRTTVGVESVASGAMANSIVTIHPTATSKGSTLYNKRSDRWNTSRRGTTDSYSISVNSTGEHTSDLRNQPEVKF